VPSPTEDRPCAWISTQDCTVNQVCANRRQPAPVPTSAPVPATTPALPNREGGRCSLIVSASGRVDRNPRYG